MGFVDFDTPQRAAAARERLQGHKFSDLEPGLSACIARFRSSSSPDIHFSKRSDQRGKRNRESFDEISTGTRRVPHMSAKDLPRLPAALHPAYGAPHPMPLSPYGAMAPNLPTGLPPAYSHHVQYPALPVDASATLYIDVYFLHFFFSNLLPVHTSRAFLPMQPSVKCLTSFGLSVATALCESCRRKAKRMQQVVTIIADCPVSPRVCTTCASWSSTTSTKPQVQCMHCRATAWTRTTRKV